MGFTIMRKCTAELVAMTLALIENKAFKPEQHSIEECLAELEKYGFPRLSKHDNGWHANIEVFVTGEGVAFKVASDFRCKTPKEAVNECYNRLIKAIKQIKDTK